MHESELCHHGVKGMKWGVRRYQNKDGTLTAAGKKRVKSDGSFKSDKEYRKEIRSERDKTRDKYNKKYGVDEAYAQADRAYQKRYDKLGYDPDDGSKFYTRAEALSSRAMKDVDRDMRSRYGKDYDNFVKGERRQGALVVAGGLTLSAAFMYGSVKLLSAGSKATANLGMKAARRIINR